MVELPNLPGLRRDISAINPKLYREFKLSQASSTSSLEELPVVEEENSLLSYFEKSNSLAGFSQTVSPYPSSGRAYNDASGRYSLVSQQQDRENKSRALPYSNLDSLPASISKGGKVCHFVAVFSEAMKDSSTQSRKVVLKVYLEDNSIEIREPKVENSGTMHGKFLKRHQILKPSGNSIYTIEDMRAGAKLEIYNRTYIILDADLYTRRYLQSINVHFGRPIADPRNVYDPTTRPGMSRAAPRTSSRPPGGLSDYFKYNTKILRFYGLWDCRENLFGDELFVKVHYSLAENTIEVVPIHNPKSGRDKLPKLLKKTSITKPRVSSATLDLEVSDDISLGSAGSSNSSRSPLSRSGTAGSTVSRAPPMVPRDSYHWTDLQIGMVIPVASMTLQLIDADDFTREFYKSKMMPLSPAIVRVPPTYPTIVETIPPYNGFGSEEDSLQTCKHKLILSAPSKDGAKLKALANMIMRYEAVMAEPGPTDADRKFIIQVHLEDDTFQIREPPVRNSGHKGGIFLARCKLESHDGSTPLLPSDLHLGALVTILSHKFRIFNCDQFTFKYMEEHCHVWIKSDIERIIKKVTPKKDVLQRLFLTAPSLANRSLTADDLGEFLQRAGCDLILQEVHTLFRLVDTYRTGSIKMTLFLKYVMDL